MKCKATRVDGKPCQAQAMADHQYCFWHSPEHREKLLEASRRGGAAGRRIPLPVGEVLTPSRARAILSGVLEAVATGSLDANTARAVGYLLQVDAKLKEKSEIEAKLEAIERAIVRLAR